MSIRNQVRGFWFRDPSYPSICRVTITEWKYRDEVVVETYESNWMTEIVSALVPHEQSKELWENITSADDKEIVDIVNKAMLESPFNINGVLEG